MSELGEIGTQQRLAELEVKYQQLAEEYNSLLERQATLKMLALGLETIDEGVMILTDRFVVEYANAAYFRMYRLDDEKLIGQVHPGVEKFRLTVGDEVFNDIQEGIGWHGEQTEQRADGEEIVTEQSINPAYSDKGISAYVVVVRDITERTQMELSLLHSQKLESIGQLAAGIAHEINTPAQYVGDNMHFIKESWEEIQPIIEVAKANEATSAACEVVDLEFIEEELPNAFSQAISGIEQISHIVLAMKNFAHPGEVVMEPVNLNEVIENVILIAKNEWKYVAFVNIDLAPDLPIIDAIPSEVNQVLLNIIVNGAHAIEARGESELGLISVKTDWSERHVKVLITDNGTGMSEKVLNRIFDPFFTTKGVGKGTGQGLAIAFRVMEKHNGTIDVDSTEGEGTTFTLKFPIKAA